MTIFDPTTYLRRDNPRLLQLEADYDALDLPFQHTDWKDHQNVGVDIANFRADGAYVGQNRPLEAYLVTYEYVKSIDKFNWLGQLEEDGAFGVTTYTFDGKRVSRDLLDSILELYFVYGCFAYLSSWQYLPPRWLDIGAGYGRMGYRFGTIQKNPGYYTCVDAVPISTFLCDFYIQYRHCLDRVGVVPLTRLDEIKSGEFDIACNIHSWSECSEAAINFWLDKLVEWRVPYLFVVPHDERWVCVNEDGSIGNFKPLVLDHGYREIATRPKYPAGVDGLYPEVHYHMFERR